MKAFAFSLILILCLPAYSNSQDSLVQDPGGVNKNRLTGVIAVQGTLYVASLTGLYFAWYKDYDHSAFHLFDDSNEWMQMDKLGHFTTSYYVGRIGYESYRWAGVDEKRSAWIGGMLGFVYLAHIEILDGFSSEWGFSMGDFTANTLGAAMFISQQLIWKEQRFVMKYSFHPTPYSDDRPELLGSNLLQNSIKDYNGQTYWLSGNISSFLPKDTWFPKWINISAGYGAEGMTGGEHNPEGVSEMPDYERYRQFYLSLDVDLTRIPVKSKPLRYLFTALNFIKIPFPAIEYNTLGKVRFHPVYF